MLSVRFIRLGIIYYLSLVLTLSSFASQSNKLIVSTQEQIAQDTAQVPCKDSERLKGVKSLFIRMGAQSEDVLTEKRNGVENIVVRKQGQAQGIIVVGAHYDKSESGCGAIDNWTGIVALTHIYRSLKDIPLQKTLIFAAFGKEEQGLYGSKAMVRGIKNEEVGQYCAMVNIDSLGMAAPQVSENLSSKPLVDRVTEIAQRMKMPVNKVTIPGAGADSIPFIEKKIPAVTISAVGNGWGEILHTKNDQVEKVNSTSVYLGYRLALALIGEVDNIACDANREKPNAK
jgi:Zn-dependent M28 family amino/carboxypeptidase